jgi:ATP-dependent Clp endopeptidase proteolytic subunit ClpP
MKSLIKIDPRIHLDRKLHAIEEPVIIRVKEFTDESAEEFEKDISKAHTTGQPVIPILIDSFGGYVYSLLSMVSDIQHSTLPVATICVGKAMSCGAVLLTCGNDGMRFCDSNATIMIHDVAGMSYGKNEEVKASTKQMDRLNKQIFRIMSKNCNKDKDYFLNKMDEKKHAEWYLNPQEAKKEGIINSISVPDIEYEISLKTKFNNVVFE